MVEEEEPLRRRRGPAPASRATSEQPDNAIVHAVSSIPATARRLLSRYVIDERWLAQGLSINLLTTLGCVHAMLFGVFHMDFFLQRGLRPTGVAAVHSVFAIWNPLSEILAGFVADEWVSRGCGTLLSLVLCANFGYAFTSLLAFQELPLVPIWLHYGAVIFASGGFAAVANTVYSLILIEQTSAEEQRIQIQRLNSVFGNAEWLVMALAYSIWDARPGHSGPSRLYMAFVCGLSVASTAAAVAGLQGGQAANAKEARPAGHGAEARELRSRVGAFLRAVLRHGNFWRFAAASAVLEAEVVFFRQFDVVLLRLLLDPWPSLARLLLAIGDPICGCVAFALTWVAERPELGVHGVTMATLRLRLIFVLASVGVLVLHSTRAGWSSSEDFSPSAWLAAALGVLMVASRAASRPAASFSTVMFANVIHEHALVEREAAQQDSPSSSTQPPEHRWGSGKQEQTDAGKYYMLRAALVRPLNSLGPVLGAAALGAAGYRQDVADSAQARAVSAPLWWTSALLPTAVLLPASLLLLHFWGSLTLHGSRLEAVKAMHRRKD